MGLGKDYKSQLKTLVTGVQKKAHAAGKHSAFCIGTTMNVENDEYFFSSVRECDRYVCGNMMISHVRDLHEIIGAIDGQVDEILIDVEKKKATCSQMDEIIHRCAKISKLGYFRGNEVAAKAFEHIVVSYCGAKGINFTGRKACVIGVGHLGAKIAGILVEYGMQVDVCDCDQARARCIAQSLNSMVARGCKGEAGYARVKDVLSSNYLLIVGATNGIEVVTAEMIDRLENDGFVIDAGLKTLTEEAARRACQKNSTVICLMASPGFNGMMVSHYQATEIVGTIGKHTVDEGFSLVSGGVIGQYGDVIVDDAITPRKVIGIAKGNGLVLAGKEKEKFHDRIHLVMDRYVRGEQE